MASSSSNGGHPTQRPLSRRATRYFVIGLLVAVLVITLIGTLYLVRTAQEAQQQRVQDEASWQARLDAFIASELESKGLPTLSIAVVDDQDFVWTQGYGLADPEREIPVTAETVYRVASVSKLFTALTVMQLVERGELDLDAPITTYLPDFRPESTFETPITLRQLHSHRSGLVREPPVGHYFDPTEPSLETMVMSLNETALVYPPETRTKYSNAAVSVAGYVVERRMLGNDEKSTGRWMVSATIRTTIDAMRLAVMSTSRTNGGSGTINTARIRTTRIGRTTSLPRCQSIREVVELMPRSRHAPTGAGPRCSRPRGVSGSPA